MLEETGVCEVQEGVWCQESTAEKSKRSPRLELTPRRKGMSASMCPRIV